MQYVVIVLALIPFILFRPFWGVLALLFLVPVEVINPVEGGTTIIRYLGFIVFAAWLGVLLIHKRRPRIHKASYFFLAYAGWSLLSALWAINPDRVFSLGLTYLQLVMLMFLLVDQVDSPRRFHQALIALLAGGALTVGIGYFWGQFSFERMIIGVGTSSTLYGYPLAFSMVAFGILAIRGRRVARLAGVAFFLLALYPTVAVGLRGAFVAIGFGLVFGSLAESVNLKTIILAVLILGFFVYGVGYVVESGVLPEGLTVHWSVENALDTGGSGRLRIWQLSYDIFKQNPVLGVGLGQFFVLSGDYAIVDFRARGTHNDYINSLVELGIPGFLLLFIGEAWCIAGVWKARRLVNGDQQKIYLGIIAGWLAASIASQMFVQLLGWKYVWVIHSLALIVSHPATWIETVKTSRPVWAARKIPGPVTPPARIKTEE